MIVRTICMMLMLLLVSCQAANPGASNPFASQRPSAAASQQGASSAPGNLPNAALLTLADDQRRAGEYEAMAESAQRVLDQQPNADDARRAEYALAESALLLNHLDEAINRLSKLAGDDPIGGRALFLLARAYESAGRWSDAIDAYTRYRALKTPIEPYAALRQAAQERAAGRTEQAIATYEYVAQQPIARGRRAEAYEHLIELYAAAGRTDLELARYRDLIALAQTPEYRAQLLWRAAQRIPGTDEARGWLRTIVTDYPARAEALDALAQLEADPNGGISPLQAATVNYLHERYAAAVPQFDAALSGELSPEDRFETRRRRALSLRGQEIYDQALSELGALAQERPVVTVAGTAQAELDYIQTVGWSGNVSWARDAYRSFADRFPASELAPEALWRAIQLQQNQSDIAGAMSAALDLGQRYPASTQAHMALTDAGLYFYQNGPRDQAIRAWQMLGSGATGSDSAEGYFWSGNALSQAGQSSEAGAQLQAAADAAPYSYYAARARDLLGHADDGTAPLGSAPSDEEQGQTVAWITQWSGTAPQDDIAAAPEIARARELGALDLRNESRDEWFGARDAWNDDPHRLWALALAASNADQPYVALKAAERIVALSPDKRITARTPSSLLRLIYPTPYARVVQREAAEFGIDPRLLYALLRQESLFNPDATSWVGARGLGQVMPTTGEGIAQNLGVQGYTPDLLYRPAVSIRFAAHYLSHQMKSFDNNVLAAASAYNGGPGNAVRWLDQTADRDLFAELIDYRETRDYVKIIYGNWGMYRSLYGP